MPAGQEPIPREGEENYVADVHKAELMAHAEDPYREFEINAQKAGLDDVAADIAKSATEAGEKAGTKYEEDQAWIKHELFEAMEKIKNRSEKPEELMFGVYYDNKNYQELLPKLQAILGISSEEHLESATVRILATSHLNGSDLRVLFHDNKPISTRATLATANTSYGELRILTFTDDSRIDTHQRTIVSLAHDHSKEVTEQVKDKVRMAGIYDKEKVANLSPEELQANFEEEARQKINEKYDLYVVEGPQN